MTLRTQALLCFATAFVAIFLYGSYSVTKYVVGVAAALIGASLWQQDKRHRAAEATRRAHVEAVGASDDETPPWPAERACRAGRPELRDVVRIAMPVLVLLLAALFFYLGRGRWGAMWRVLAYLGKPAVVDDLLFQPDNSLVRQATDPTQLHMMSLGGFAWSLGDRLPSTPAPIAYHTTALPLFDVNLKSLASIPAAPAAPTSPGTAELDPQPSAENSSRVQVRFTQASSLAHVSHGISQ